MEFWRIFLKVNRFWGQLEGWGLVVTGVGLYF